MQRSLTRSRLVILLSLAAGLALCVGIRPARAQIGTGPVTMPTPGNAAGPLLNGPIQVGPKSQPGPAAPAPPPALPGAAARVDRVAPATSAPIADPNAALFDAINRGDIASARDALDRGADLSGHNVLGMTPLDLSIDLGRNDITFLLLSLRNGDSSAGPKPPGQGTSASALLQGGPGGKPAAGGTKSAAHATTRAAAAKPVRQAERIVPTAPAAPRLFANDGGTPDPSAGFLGFNSRP